MDVVVTGSSGLIGSALVGALRSAGHRPVRMVRRPAAGADEIAWDPSTGTIDTASLEGIDGVVHLAGAGIGDKRWTESYKREILESRTQGTGLLASALAGLARRPSVLLSGSGVGYYGRRGDEVLDETAPAGSGFLADVVQAWEEATAPAVSAGIRTAFLRTGIVLSPDGGALKKQLPIFKSGLGGRFGKGRNWQSWISIDDEVGATVFLLGAPVSGPVNLTAPNPVTNAEFARVLGSVLRRPTALPIPAFGPKLLLGSELAEALLFTGQRVAPRVLEAAGYRFTHPDLEGALRSLLDKPAA
jgi:uncharacterized protein